MAGGRVMAGEKVMAGGESWQGGVMAGGESGESHGRASGSGNKRYGGCRRQLQACVALVEPGVSPGAPVWP